MYTCTCISYIIYIIGVLCCVIYSVYIYMHIHVHFIISCYITRHGMAWLELEGALYSTQQATMHCARAHAAT
jgi:hypothetical protein